MTIIEFIEAFCARWEELFNLVDGKSLPLTGNDHTRAAAIKSELEGLGVASWSGNMWGHILGS